MLSNWKLVLKQKNSRVILQFKQCLSQDIQVEIMEEMSSTSEISFSVSTRSKNSSLNQSVIREKIEHAWQKKSIEMNE
jgi:hypothetical protein